MLSTKEASVLKLTTPTSKPTTDASLKQPDLSKIDAAPYELDGSLVVQEAQFYEILSENSRLRFENETLEAENQRLSGKVDIAEEKAKLIRPFSWWVLGFAAIYCIVIFGIIILDGWNDWFNLQGSVLPIMAGSTAAAVLGLVSVILTGLFKD